ncbi:MAG: RICIN domain-containing protein [Pseudomonadota bacterium]
MFFIKPMIYSGALFLGCALAGAANAGEYTTTQQTLNGGDNIYKVEVTGLDTFQVRQDGDPESSGELHEVVIRLTGDSTSHSYTVPVTGIYNKTKRRGGNTAYLEVDVGDIVSLERRRRREPANLWLHRQDNRSIRSAERYPTTVLLEVATRELDCLRERVCNRGNRGLWGLRIELPAYDTPPPAVCGPTNTYRLTRIDDKVQVIGLPGRSEYSSSSANRALKSNIIQRSAEGVIIRPTRGQVCITSVNNDTQTAFLRNVTSNRCLSPPRTEQNADDAAASIDSCRLNVSPASATAQKWQLIQRGDDRYSIKNTVTDMCLNLRSSSDNREGGSVKLVGCSSHPDQLWKKVQAENGAVRFQNVASGKCLNVHGGRENRDGGRTSVYSCANSPDQSWQLIDQADARLVHETDSR